MIWSGPAFDPSGYGRACRDYVMALHNNDVDIKLQAIKYTSGIPPDFIDSDIKKTLLTLLTLRGDDWAGHNLGINHITPDIARRFPLQYYIKHNVLYSVWETSHIPQTAVGKVNEFDLLMTPSEYSMNAFKNSGVTIPIEVIPHIIKDVDSSIRFDDIDNVVNGKFVFFSNFEWHYGKGYDLLFEAYTKAFSGNKDVLLIAKTNLLCAHRNPKRMIVDYIKSIKGDNKYPAILPIASIINAQKLQALYSSASCYVLPSRREGWCLTASEAAMAELPIIIPSIGGQREFLHDNDALFVESKMVPIKNLEMERSLYDGQEWVEPGLDSLIYQMQQVYYNYQEHKENAKEVKRKLLKKYNEKAVAEQIKFVLKQYFDNYEGEVQCKD